MPLQRPSWQAPQAVGGAHRLTLSRAPSLLLTLMMGTACGAGTSTDSELAPASECRLGDTALPLEFEIVHRAPDGTVVATPDLAEIPLFPAIQGGMMLLVGVRVRNVIGCRVDLGTALVDTDTQAVVSLERRPITLSPGAEGWLQPARPEALSNYSSLPACPRANLSRSVNDEVYELQVDVEAAGARAAQGLTRIVPVCGDDASHDTCRCLCAKDYVLGDSCGAGS